MGTVELWQVSQETSARKWSKKFQIPSLTFLLPHSLHDKYAIGIVLDDAVYRGAVPTP